MSKKITIEDMEKSAKNGGLKLLRCSVCGDPAMLSTLFTQAVNARY